MVTALSTCELHENSRAHLETTPIRIKGILAATDLSPQATRALRIAARLARLLRCRLHVLYAVSPQLYVADTGALTSELCKIEVEHAREELHKYASKIPEFRTVRHEEIALCGSALGSILETVETKGIDLVVMGSHGRGGLVKVVLGSVAEAAIRRLHCPVLVVGPHCVQSRKSLRSAVLATDFPDSSLRAAQYAVSISRESGATLTVVHVAPEEVDALRAPGIIKELRQLVPDGTEAEDRVRFEFVKGKPAEEILRVAERAKADLIVMGVKENSMLTDRVPWATLSEVIRGAHCPVLAVQPYLV